MEFKNWLLQEMAHFSLPTTVIDGVTINMIDLRFEDYPKSNEEDKNLIVRLMGGREPYYGKIPKSNKYITFDGRSHRVSPKEPLGWEYLELPNPFKNGYTWWDYAAGLYYDSDTQETKTVKKPLKLRTYE